jgi:hypothetical protein
LLAAVAGVVLSVRWSASSIIARDCVPAWYCCRRRACALASQPRGGGREAAAAASGAALRLRRLQR